MQDPSTLLSPPVLALTGEEALALLEMCALTLAPECPLHLQILSRLSRFYSEERQQAWIPPKSPDIVFEEVPSS